MKRKLLAFSHNFELNGSNHCLLMILEQLASDYRIEIVSASDGPLRSQFEFAGIRVHIRTVDEKSGLRCLEPELFFNVNLTLVNTLICSDALLASESHKIPHLWMIHEMWDLENLEKSQKEVWKWTWPNSSDVLKAMHVSKNIIFPAKISMLNYDKFIKDKNVAVIYNGIPKKWSESNADFPALRNTSRSNELITETEVVFLHIGSICERKGQHSSMEAFSLLKKRNPQKKVKLCFVGERKIREHEIKYTDVLREMIKENGLESIVSIHPATSDVLPFYSIADCLLIPSKSEVLPLVIGEAFTLGLPVLASDIDGIPEVVFNGENGYIFPEGDVSELLNRMELFISDFENHKSYSANCRKTADKYFSFDRMINSYKDLIQKCLK